MIGSDDSDTQSAAARAMEVKRAYEDELLAKANVVGVGVGFEEVGGQKTDQVAVVVMVSQKLPPERLAPEDLLPASIEGVPVDVKEVGEIRAF
jgi:hypothetical protein